MRQEKIILSLVMLVLVLSIILMTGIGYAAETGNTLKISDNPLLILEQDDFKIEFDKNPTYIGDGIAEVKMTGPTNAIIDITDLKEVGDYVTVIFVIENKSNSICADIKTKVTNTNTQFFDTRVSLSESILKPKIGKTILELTVELIRLPIKNDETSYISIDIMANPIYD